MCGRLDQSPTAAKYATALRRLRGAPHLHSKAAPSFNASPGPYRPLMRIIDGSLMVEDLFWGYRAAWAAGREDRCESGFVLVTAYADAGMVDVDDRHPIVFCAEDAARWMDPALDAAQAGPLAHSMALGPGEFAWHAVTTEAGKATGECAHLAARLDLPLA